MQQQYQQQPYQGQGEVGGYAMKPLQPGAQFNHLPHTEFLVRGAQGSEHGPIPQGATSLEPNVEHHERQAPQFDYNTYPPPHHQQVPQPMQPMPSMQPMQQQMYNTHQLTHPTQQQQQMYNPQQSPSPHPQGQGHPAAMQQQMQMRRQQQQQQLSTQNGTTHLQQRLAQQTGPAPVAAEVITKTKNGLSTNRILLIVLISIIFLGIGIGIIVICKKNKIKKL